jgi:hypothetical protein
MLIQTHDQLEGHFNDLSRERVPLGYPVYAFEHGLESEQVQSLRKALCDDLVRTERLKHEHWLLWTVVAAEIGYTYDGDEYWYSFENEIPRWISLGSREAVRGWFHDFIHHFNGFQPTGRWAEHFSIIAWPITHSILPRYLQAQFARHLYDLRHDLAAKEATSVDELGHLLGTRYHGGSSRFENFLQQTALTARLVLALRDEDVQDSVAPIYRPTLARIVRDLEQKGSSRSYLRDARRVLRDARTHARAGLTGPKTSTSSGVAGQNSQTFPPGIKLVARRAQDDSWTVGAALPNFIALMAELGLAPATLDKMRFQFVDRPQSWVPGRGLLSYSNSNHALSALPSSLTDPVIRFRQPSEDFNGLLPYLKIPSRPPWLLRIHNDGVARQVLGNNVRTGEEYIVATFAPANPEISKALSLRHAVSRTAGTVLYTLRVPPSVPPTFVQALHSFSLGYALRACVKPFGLVPRWNEANGCSVWLINEEILLHLSADFHITEFSLTLNGQGRSHLPMADAQEALVSLGLLPPGRYAIEITATAKKNAVSANAMRLIAPETIVFEVRAPTPWRTDTTARTGLRTVLQPPDASFDDLVEKRASLVLHGPDGRTATIEARLYDVSGHISSSTEVGRLELPSNEGAIARAVEKLSKEPLSEKIQSAPRVDLAFLADELGVATVSFPRKVAPLRWKLKADGAGSTIRLVDETGATANILISRYDMATPDRRVDVALSVCTQGVAVNPPGSLFVARSDAKMYAALASVPPPGKLSDFSQLIPGAVLDAPGGSSRNILRLLAILRIWRLSRPLGALAAIRKRAILELIETRIEQLACGNRWADRTLHYRKNGGRLEDLQADVGGSPGFALRMRTTEWTWHSYRAHACAEFFRVANTYGVCIDRGICDLALRLAFHPSSIRLTDPKQGAHDFEELGKLQILARGAYFAKLTSDLRFQESQVPTEAAE